jgi:hypothetical protein
MGRVGLNCNSTLCGRPAHWPADKPFFLPLDLQDPDVWLKIGAAQPTLTDVTPEKQIHLQVAATPSANCHVPHVLFVCRLLATCSAALCLLCWPICRQLQ